MQYDPSATSVNEYEGFKVPYPAYSITRVSIDTLTPQSFFETYVSTRTPVILKGYMKDAEFRARERWKSFDYLDKLAGNEIVQVEKRQSEADTYGRGNEVPMTFHDFISLLRDGDTLHYLTTQDVHVDNESGRPNLMAPFVQCLSYDFPLRPKLMGNLIPQNINIWMGNSKNGASSGLHHDYHDNLYVLLRGKKTFRLYSPADAERMYTRGQLMLVHRNGRINYRGEKTTAYGADVLSNAAFLAGKETEIAEKELCDAELAMQRNDDGAKEALLRAESRLDAALSATLIAEFSEDEGSEDGESQASECEQGHSESESDGVDCPVLADRTVADPINFSKIDVSLLNSPERLKKRYPRFGDAKAAFCEIEEGEMLYLPASWFHEVRSIGDTDGHMALNYWFHPPDKLDDFTEPYTESFWPRDFEERVQKRRKLPSNGVKPRYV